MTIHFLYGRRESLTAKAEAYKKVVRKYLESLGFSQTTDSFTEGTFADMTFYNPVIAQGKRFLIETKAEKLSLNDFEFANELVKYFRLWQRDDSSERFKFYLFVQAVRPPEKWEAIFSENNDIHAVRQWCEWYNANSIKKDKQGLTDQEIESIGKFFAESEVKVANSQRLETAIGEKEEKSSLAITKMAQKLLSVVGKRTTPTMKKSTIIMNILPVQLPKNYYVSQPSTRNKKDIFEALKGQELPPFVLKSGGPTMLSFIEFNQNNPLTKFAIGSQSTQQTVKLQQEDPALCSELVNVFLRKIVWNRGIYRDMDSDISYFPMLEKTNKVRMIMGPNGRKQWVVKKYAHLEDTKYAKKGETNFFFHRGLKLNTPVYWGNSYIEITPVKYYTYDGSTTIDGEIRKKLDTKFRNPQYDRSNTKIRQMRFWRFVLFEPEKNNIKPEAFFRLFQFGDFVTQKVDWSPNVIEKAQTRLWDFGSRS